MNLEGLSSACAKLEPASSKDNEILEINVLQKFTSHALKIGTFVPMATAVVHTQSSDIWQFYFSV